MTPEEIYVIRHSLGCGDDAKKKPYRNHFATYADTRDYTTCMALASLGFMHVGRRELRGDGGSMVFFHVTQAGADAAGSTLPKDD